MYKGLGKVFRRHSIDYVFAKPTGVVDWNAEWKRGDTYERPEAR